MGAITAERTWAAKQTREEWQTLSVLVVGQPRENVVATRGKNRVQVSPFIIVQQAVDPNDLAAIDALVELTEEIEEQIERTQLAGADWVSQTQAELTTEYLHSLQLFLMLFSATFEMHE